MTYSSVFVNRIDSSLLEPDYNEIFRYMGYGLKDRTELDDEVRKMVYQIVPEFQKILCPQGVYVFYPLKIENENLIFKKHFTVMLTYLLGELLITQGILML